MQLQLLLLPHSCSVSSLQAVQHIGTCRAAPDSEGVEIREGIALQLLIETLAVVETRDILLRSCEAGLGVHGYVVDEHGDVWNHDCLHGGLGLTSLEAHLRDLHDDLFIVLHALLFVFLVLERAIVVVAHDAANVLLVLDLLLVRTLDYQVVLVCLHHLQQTFQDSLNQLLERRPSEARPTALGNCCQSRVVFIKVLLRFFFLLLIRRRRLIKHWFFHFNGCGVLLLFALLLSLPESSWFFAFPDNKSIFLLSFLCNYRRCCSE